MNLNSKAVRGILPLLALRPGEGHTLSDLARFSGLDTKSVWQTLSQLRLEGALLDGAFGPRTYSINPDYEFYPEIRVIAFRLLGFPRILVDAGARPDLVVLFGSVLRPVFRRESDIDVLVVGRNDLPARSSAAQLSERLGKKVNVAFYKPDDFVARWRARDQFLLNVFEGPHAVLEGSFDRLGLGGIE